MDEETLTAIRERYPRTSATQVEESARASLEGAELPVSAIYTSTPQEVRDIWALLAEVERLRVLEEENAQLRALLSDAYDSWFYGDEASYSSPPWVDRAMALLGKAR